MEQAQIARLFGLFAGDDTLGETYGAVLETAVLVGFLRYTQITAARDRAACTFAGTVAQNTDGSQKLRFAELLVQAYENLCHALLEEKSFLFLAVA